MPSDCRWGTTRGQSASCRKPSGILHTWDAWSVTYSATNPSTPTGTKRRTWLDAAFSNKECFGGEGVQLGEACDCLKTLSALYLTQEGAGTQAGCVSGGG